MSDGTLEPLAERSSPEVAKLAHCPEDIVAATPLRPEVPGVATVTIAGLERIVAIDPSCYMLG
jgi:hypothetical protein